MDEVIGLIAKERTYPRLGNVAEEEYSDILRTSHSHAQSAENDCGGYESLELWPETPDLNEHHEDPDSFWSDIYTWMLQVSDFAANRLESNMLYQCLILTPAVSRFSALCVHAPFSTDCRHIRFEQRMYLLRYVIL